MTTPTPGDLSARLQKLSDACLSRRLTPAECGEFHDCIAALSALPAAGGEESSRTLFGCAYQLAGYHDAPEVWLDRLSDAMQGRPLPDSDTLIAQLLPYAPDTPEKWDGHTHVASEEDGDTCEVCGRNFRAHATTPQPSAAECNCACHRNPHIKHAIPCCQPSAAVGAQGGAVLAWQNIENAEAEFLCNLADNGDLPPLVGGMLRHCARLLDKSATTAVGKNVDDALIELIEADKNYDKARKGINFNLPLVIEAETRRSTAIEAAQAALAAPAAGKGVDDAMVERFCAAFFTPKWPTSSTHNDNVLRGMVRPALEAALTRQPVAGDGMVLVPREPTEAMVEATDCAPRLARVTWAKMLAAAPAATPTDGGEGNNAR